MSKANFISKEEYMSLIPGQYVKTRFMDEGMVISLPGDEVKIKFTNGPWKDQTLPLIRQQIKKVCIKTQP